MAAFNLSDLIRAGAMEQFVGHFRWCRDNMAAAKTSCRDYAERKLQRTFPQASASTLSLLVDKADRARARGTDYRRGGTAYEPGDWREGDVTQSLYRSQGIGTLIYRYRLRQVRTYTYSDGTTETRTLPFTLDSLSALSRAEVERRAAELAGTLPMFTLNVTDPRKRILTDIQDRFDIEAAYRTRTY